MLKLQPRRHGAASPAPMVQALENPVRAEETKDRRLLHWPHPTPTTVPKPTAKSQRLPSAHRSTPCTRRAITRHKSEKASKLRTQNLNVYHFPIEINLKKKKILNLIIVCEGPWDRRQCFSMDVVTVKMSHRGGAMMRKGRCSFKRRKKRTNIT